MKWGTSLSETGDSCEPAQPTGLTAEQRAAYQNPDAVRTILNGSRRVAVVGLSTDSQKASHQVADYLKTAGWQIVPVNPKADTILGLKAYPDLKSIPGPIDLVDIFRPTADVGPFVDDAIAIGAKAVWQQLGILNVEAAEKARQAGLLSIVDLCVKIELIRMRDEHRVV
jgi:predicted CoA-binding protein